MKQGEKQTCLHFRFMEKGFLPDEQEGEYVDAILPWKEQFETDK